MKQLSALPTLILVAVAGLGLAANSPAGFTNTDNNIYLPLLSVPAPQGLTTLVSVASDGSHANDYSWAPAISADGRFVAFVSSATNLSEYDAKDCYDVGEVGVITSSPDVFVHDRLMGETTLVSVASDGCAGNDWSSQPSISADGRFVAFGSPATNLVNNDTVYDCYDPNTGTYTLNCSDVFVRDLQAGETTLVSVASDGAQGNGDSHPGAISADGRFVVFGSWATNLVTGDTNGVSDIFVHDRLTGVTTRVSIASDGSEANDDALFAAISADGRFVAFTSGASNLVEGDTNDQPDIFMHDRQTGDTTRISGATGSDLYYANPSISADGRVVAFSADRNFLEDDSIHCVSYVPTCTDVFVYDRTTGESTRVSILSDGGVGYYSSFEASISAGGRFVAFSSNVSLTPGDTNFCTKNGCTDVFVHDRLTKQTALISGPDTGTQESTISNQPAISADGRFVAFFSLASNLVAGDTNERGDVFVRDRWP